LGVEAKPLVNLVERQGDVVAEDADLDVAGAPALPEHASTTSNESGATVSDIDASRDIVFARSGRP
jgi:hypothetical protein